VLPSQWTAERCAMVIVERGLNLIANWYSPEKGNSPIGCRRGVL
jgi:hypothetical protein